MGTTIRAAVVGCGGAGRNHASGYRSASGVELVAVCDIDEDRSDSLADELGVASSYDVAELLETYRPDIVSVATPEPYHVEPTVTALVGGADVLCEKPMAGSVADACEMVETAESTGNILAVDYNYRHMPAFAAIRDGVADGVLGDVHLATADVHAFGWHHTLDLLVFLFGEPRTVRATREHDPSVLREEFRFDDIVYVPSHSTVATFEFPSGVTATVASTRHSSLETHLIDFAVYGEDGRARLTGMTPADSTGTVAPGPLASTLRSVESITLDESFEHSVAAFVDAVRAGEELQTAGRHGLRLIELEHAVVRAAETDATVEL